jgi:hypothetical protein
MEVLQKKRALPVENSEFVELKVVNLFASHSDGSV